MGNIIYPEIEGHHFGSCKYHILAHHVSQTYLAQMHRYRHQNSSTPIFEVSDSPAPPIPHFGGQAPPTQFKVEHSAPERKSSLQESMVEAEYQKYASGDLSSHKTDILKFWEVRLMFLCFLDVAMTHTLIGQ